MFQLARISPLMATLKEHMQYGCSIKGNNGFDVSNHLT